MRDLTFTGTIDATDVNVTFRTDLINSSDQNFTVMQIMVGETFSPNDEKDDDYESKFGEFKKLAYNMDAFKSFAEDNGLKLVSTNTDGSDEVVLVEEESSESA